MIEYINKLMSRDQLKLSDAGEKSVRDRWKKSEAEGGYSEYWKEVSLAEALSSSASFLSPTSQNS